MVIFYLQFHQCQASYLRSNFALNSFPEYFARYEKLFRRFAFYTIFAVHSRECSIRNPPHNQASYLYLHRWAIRQMSYFVVGQAANVERPCAAAGVAAVGDQRRGTISTVAW
jgi:hypothetical protein